jgi:hypothetical protein
VVDVHHKPHGLTSLSRCYISQVHNVQHKPRKKLSWGLNNIWSKTWECAEKWRPGQCPVHQAEQHSNQPLSSFFWARSFIIQRTCPVSQRSNDNLTPTVGCKREQYSAEVRAHRTCPVSHRTVRCNYKTKGSNDRLLQTPTGVLTWRAPGLSGVPIASKTSQRLGSGWRL